MFRKYVLPYLIFAFYKLWTVTWRVQLVESDEYKNSRRLKKITPFACWHGDELVGVYLSKKFKACTMSSTSKDGELMNTVLNLAGVATSRGSSTRGAVQALKGLIRLTQQGYSPVVAVDGPKGPYHKVKPGVFEIARLCGEGIFAMGVHCESALRFPKSWNQTYLPYPFAKIVVVWRYAMPPLDSNVDARSPELAKRLEEALGAAQQEARKIFAAHQAQC